MRDPVELGKLPGIRGRYDFNDMMKRLTEAAQFNIGQLIVAAEVELSYCHEVMAAQKALIEDLQKNQVRVPMDSIQAQLQIDQ